MKFSFDKITFGIICYHNYLVVQMLTNKSHITAIIYMVLNICVGCLECHLRSLCSPRTYKTGQLISQYMYFNRRNPQHPTVQDRQLNFRIN